MSGQTSQRPRRNNSPSTKQGPIKATLQFSLRQGSPTRNGRKSSPSSSPTPYALDPYRSKTRRSPDNRSSPERRSPNSPSATASHKVERPKPVRGSPIRRTGSLDTIAGPYLSGKWPTRDITESYYTSLGDRQSGMMDKYTQTPEEWDEDRKKKGQGHKRSSSLGGNGDLKELIKYKQRLQRTKEGSKQPGGTARQSPIHGNHAALANPPIVHTPSKPMSIPLSHISKSPRTRGSVEGLNQEIEKVFIQQNSGKDCEDMDRMQEVTPDGHRAPIAEIIQFRSSSSTRSIDTQTPSGFNGDDSGSSSSGGNSRSQSVSPSFPIIPGEMDKSRTLNDIDHVAEKTKDLQVVDQNERQSKYAASPRPNKSYNFVRGPPDGAEKVKVNDENKRYPVIKESLAMNRPAQQTAFVFTQSDSSAFVSPKLMSVTMIPPVVKSPISSSSAQTLLGGQ